jgi:hypothetical protein
VGVTEERFDIVEEEEEAAIVIWIPSAGMCFLRWKAGRLNFVAVKLEQLWSPP